MVLSSSSAVSLVTLKADRNYWSHLPPVILTDSLFGKQSLEMQKKSKARLMGWNKNMPQIIWNLWEGFVFPWVVLKYRVPGREEWPSSVLWRGLWPPGSLARPYLATTLMCLSPIYLSSQLWEMAVPAKEESCSQRFCLCPGNCCPPAGLNGPNWNIRNRPNSSFPVRIVQAFLKAAALILGLISRLDGQS